MASTTERDAPTAATFMVGPLDSIEDVNDAACTLLGYSRAELLTMHGSDLVPVERHSQTAVALDRIRRGELTTRDGVLERKDGTVVGVAVEARVLDARRLLLTVREHSAR